MENFIKNLKKPSFNYAFIAALVTLGNFITVFLDPASSSKVLGINIYIIGSLVPTCFYILYYKYLGIEYKNNLNIPVFYKWYKENRSLFRRTLIFISMLVPLFLQLTLPTIPEYVDKLIFGFILTAFSVGMISLPVTTYKRLLKIDYFSKKW